MANTENESVEKAPEAVVKPAPSRDDLRKKFFSPENTEVMNVPLTWNGINFEWRRPTITQVQEARDQNEDGERNFIVDILIGYAYIEGTDEKLFDHDDYEVLIGMPFTGEFQEIVNKIGGAINLKVEEKVKN